jgi:RimJ/RimL family protein N-acetyltransferase
MLRDGASLGVRPLGAADRDAYAASFARLSDESRRRRFLGPKPKLSARELTYLTEVDQRTHVALVARDDRGRIVAEARYAGGTEPERTADIAITVDDAWQGRGIGTRLAALLVRAARENGMAALTALTLHDNDAAVALLRRLGFRFAGRDGEALEFELRLA